MSNSKEPPNETGIRERLHHAFGKFTAFAILTVAVNVVAMLLLHSSASDATNPDGTVAGVTTLIPLLTIASCFGLFFAGRSMARVEARDLAEPIELLTAAVESLSRRRGGDDLPIPEGTELADLTRGFNRMRSILGKANETVSSNMAAFQRTNLLLQRSNKELENFAYVASHDLRSPLAAIDQLSGFVLEDCEEILPEESKEDLVELRRRVNRLADLVTQLLNYSRIGRKESDPEEVDVGEMLHEIREMLSPDDEFTITIPDTMPTIRTPKAALYLIFRNLISNSLKHHNRKDGCITLAGQEGDTHWQFSVSDDGPGIAPEHHDRIFQLFKTLAPKDDTNSSGMGLAMIKKTVEHYGGEVSIESEAGQGARFNFSWPKQITRDSVIGIHGADTILEQAA